MGFQMVWSPTASATYLLAGQPLSDRRSLEPAVLQEMPHLLGRFAAPQERRVPPGQHDVIALAAEARARFEDKNVRLGGNDSEFGHFGAGQRANEALVFVGQLDQR